MRAALVFVPSSVDQLSVPYARASGAERRGETGPSFGPGRRFLFDLIDGAGAAPARRRRRWPWRYA
jgi:hypothetical protein